MSQPDEPMDPAPLVQESPSKRTASSRRFVTEPPGTLEEPKTADEGETAPAPIRPAAPADRPAGSASPPRLGLRSSAFWVVGAMVAFTLDGPWGLMAPFVVGLVVLAGLPRAWMGRIGLAALVAVPVSIVLEGIPTRAQVSPRFVNRSAWPTHLTFVGLFLVITWTLLELAPTLGQAAGARRVWLDQRRTEPAPRWGVVLRYAIVGTATALLAAATAAVMAA